MEGVRLIIPLGQFPGPLIEARSGDVLSISVHNQLLEEGVALHFHGLHMESKSIHQLQFTSLA